MVKENKVHKQARNWAKYCFAWYSSPFLRNILLPILKKYPHTTAIATGLIPVEHNIFHNLDSNLDSHRCCFLLLYNNAVPMCKLHL